MSNTDGVNTYTLIFDSDDGEPKLVVVQAIGADDALHVAEETLQRNEKWPDDYYHVITFHGDVTNLVAE